MHLKKVSKGLSLRQQVQESLRVAVVEGKLLPGQRLTEEGVAEFLGVSRTPAREALGLLCQEGVLERRPAGGYLVPVPSVEKTEHIFDVRHLLEPFAARVATTNAKPADIEYLREVLEGERAALHGAEPTEFLTANREFRNRLVSLTRNEQLMDCISRYNDHLQFVGSLTLGDISIRKIALEGQERVLAAVAAGDPAGAEAAMHAQISAARESLIAALTKVLDEDAARESA